MKGGFHSDVGSKPLEKHGLGSRKIRPADGAQHSLQPLAQVHPVGWDAGDHLIMGGLAGKRLSR